MPRLPKLPNEVADKRNGAQIVLSSSRQPGIPEAPSTLSEIAKLQWLNFWLSPIAPLVEDVDLPALTRLYEQYDERTECERQFKDDRTTIGSTGQEVLNPLHKRISDLNSEITKLEDRFGITPLARSKLGSAFAEAARTINDLNRETLEETYINGGSDYDSAVYVIED